MIEWLKAFSRQCGCVFRIDRTLRPNDSAICTPYSYFVCFYLGFKGQMKFAEDKAAAADVVCDECFSELACSVQCKLYCRLNIPNRNQLKMNACQSVTNGVTMSIQLSSHFRPLTQAPKRQLL